MKIKKTPYYYFAIVWILIQTSSLLAQNKVQVFTTTIEKTISFKTGDFIDLKGEKSNITIETWDKKEVKIILKIISKNSDKNLAEKELLYMKYFLDKTGHKIELNNYFLIPSNVPKVTSNIKAEYEIWIPKESPITIKNYYGKINIKNTNEKVLITNSYGLITLNNMKGKITVNANFSDVVGNNVTGTFTGDADHSDVTLTNLSGEYKIKSDFGSIFLADLNKTTALEIITSKGDAEVSIGNFKDFNYDLLANFGEIKLPEGYESLKIINTANKASFDKKFSGLNSKLKINTSFGKITIK
jgi:hypothetical protein